MKIKTDIVKIDTPNPQKPPIAEFLDDKWFIKTSYPNENSVAGTYMLLGADGSVSEITLDEEGSTIREVLVKPKTS